MAGKVHGRARGEKWRGENIRRSRAAPPYHPSTRVLPTTTTLLTHPLSLPTSQQRQQPPNGLSGTLLHLSSAGRLDAAARCVGVSSTRLWSHNSVCASSIYLSPSNSISLFPCSSLRLSIAPISLILAGILHRRPLGHPTSPSSTFSRVRDRTRPPARE